MVTRRNPQPSGDDHCPVRQVLAVLGDKWSHVILFLLGDGPLRFSELQQRIPDISKKMLAQSLERLTADQLLERSVAPTRPPQVRYALTPLGQRFREPLVLLFEWGTTHAAAIRQVLRRRQQRAAQRSASPPSS